MSRPDVRWHRDRDGAFAVLMPAKRRYEAFTSVRKGRGDGWEWRILDQAAPGLAVAQTEPGQYEVVPDRNLIECLVQCRELGVLEEAPGLEWLQDTGHGAWIEVNDHGNVTMKTRVDAWRMVPGQEDRVPDGLQDLHWESAIGTGGCEGTLPLIGTGHQCVDTARHDALAVRIHRMLEQLGAQNEVLEELREEIQALEHEGRQDIDEVGMIAEEYARKVDPVYEVALTTSGAQATVCIALPQDKLDVRRHDEYPPPSKRFWRERVKRRLVVVERITAWRTEWAMV